MVYFSYTLNHTEFQYDLIHFKIVSMVVVSCRTPRPSHNPIAPPMFDRNPEKENSGKKYSVMLTLGLKEKFMSDSLQSTLLFEISTPLI